MKPIRRNSGLWTYLEKLGKIDAQGDELAMLKRQYRRAYMAAYKKQERTTKRFFTVCFKRAETEAIIKASKEHRLSENAFVKKAVQAYLTTTYVVRDRIVLDMVLQSLLKYQVAIQQVRERDQGSWFKADRDYEALAKAINSVRREITEAFGNPPKLEEALIAELQNNPSFITVLKRLSNEYS